MEIYLVWSKACGNDPQKELETLEEPSRKSKFWMEICPELSKALWSLVTFLQAVHCPFILEPDLAALYGDRHPVGRDSLLWRSSNGWLCGPFLVGTHGHAVRNLAAHQFHLPVGVCSCHQTKEPPSSGCFHPFLLNWHQALGAQDSGIIKRPSHSVIT